MRVDKYLWAIRVFKTRSQASTHCREGKVVINGQKIKPAREIKLAEKIVVRKGAIHFSYNVIQIPKSRVGASLVTDYVDNVTDEKELEKLKMIKIAAADRPYKLGRPTKRDRRDWEKAFED